MHQHSIPSNRGAFFYASRWLANDFADFHLQAFCAEAGVPLFEVGAAGSHKNVHLCVRLVTEAIYDQYVAKTGIKPGTKPFTNNKQYHAFD